MPPGASRLITVANSYTPDTSSPAISDVVPIGAAAIAYNLTITGTVGAGYLSVNPGDAAAITASSINWGTSGLSLANGLVVKLDANRQILVFCQGGTTHVIIDALGYYL
jgi:hypothetical protein